MNALKIVIVVSSLVFNGLVHAIDDRADIDPAGEVKKGNQFAWKLTTSQHRNSVSGLAHDINIRANTEKNTYWFGTYKDKEGFEQSRIGAEDSYDFSHGRIISSLQIATHGFVGGSVTWDARVKDQEGLKPMLGFGRTNLKPYYNLNFDPNDSILWGMSYKEKALGQFNFYQVFDDRLGTGQRLTHFVWRKPVAQGRRLTIDLFSKRGSSEKGLPSLSGGGVSTTLDIDDYFIRLAHETKANFSEESMSRISVGFRF